MSRRKRQKDIKTLAEETEREFHAVDEAFTAAQKEQMRRFYWFTFQTYENLIAHGMSESDARLESQTKIYEWLKIQGTSKETAEFPPIPDGISKQRTLAFVKFTLSGLGPDWDFDLRHRHHERTTE